VATVDKGKSKHAFFKMPVWMQEAFPPPEFLRLNFTGLNISDHSIKICKTVINGNRYLIQYIDTIAIPSGSVVSGHIENEGEVRKVLEQIKHAYKLEFVRFSIPEEKVYLVAI